jgi:hypothetical protein
MIRMEIDRLGVPCLIIQHTFMAESEIFHRQIVELGSNHWCVVGAAASSTRIIGYADEPASEGMGVRVNIPFKQVPI